MINYLLLALVTVGVSVQQISKKSFSQKVPNGAYSFCAGSALMALVVFLITSGGKFVFTYQTLYYAIAFTVSYSVCTVTSMLAVKTGPLSLTSLMVSYSLIIPALYGLIMLGEPIKLTLIIGIILLLISLFFINIEKKGEPKKITLKWIIYVFLAFVCNGACSAIQKVQQLSSNGLYKTELMIMSLIITTIVLTIFAGFNEKKDTLVNLKKGFWLFAICGIANGVVNYLVLLLSNRLPASVMFPVISAGGIVLSAIVAITVYKEKLSKYQWIGMILGTISIISLNM
jgi:drug/metabolite transporter (DMT)-like permease